MRDSSENLFKFERRILKKAKSTINDYKNNDNPLLKEYKSLTRKYKKLLLQSEKILRISDNNQEKLRKTQQNLALLLNNVKQGFLTFGEDFIIDPEYSQECKNIFNKDIAGENIYELLLEKSDSDAEKEILHSIFKDDKSKVKLYLPLLPKEIELIDKLLKIRYKYIEEENKVMCIITDITEKRELENKLEQERKNLKMTITVITNKGVVKKYINDYKNFFNNVIYEWLDKYDESKILENLYRKIHTYKGVFSQWGMRNSAESLHEVENKITNYKDNSDKEDQTTLKEFLAQIDFINFLNEDIEIMEKILGKDFLQEEKSVVVKKDVILKLKEKVKQFFPEQEKQNILKRIDRFIKKSIEDLIGIYEEYTFQLADRVGKKLDEFIIESEEVLVNENNFHDFNKSLIHIFRNCIYHGIEKPEERLKKGKDEGGTVKCVIKQDEEKIYITISDDGQGIDIEELKQRALKNKLYSTDEIDSISRQEILKLIFLDEFSTETNTNQTAGRGVGMASVKNEIDKLGGKISVSTRLDHGTEFKIELPREEGNIGTQEFKINNLMTNLEDKFMQYLEQDLNLKLHKTHKKSQSKDNIKLSDFNVITNIKFNDLYDIILSVDHRAAQILMENFINRDLNSREHEQQKDYIKESLNEIINIVIGKVFSTNENIEGSFQNAPEGITVEGGLLNYKNDDMIKSKFLLEKGKIKLNLIERCKG